MHKKGIEIWFFSNNIVKHSKKIVLMDSDASQRTLRLASSYGSMLYVRQNNNEANNTMHICHDAAASAEGLLKAIDEFKKHPPNFRISIVSQSSKQAMSINEDLIRRYPELKINILAGSDSGMTKKEYCLRTSTRH